MVKPDDNSTNTSLKDVKYTFKLIVVGDSAVGKTAILNAFKGKPFNSEYNNTVGLDFASQVIDIDDCHVRLLVWDTAGQENFRSVTRAYYRGSAGVLIVYDVSERKSFENVQIWLSDCRKYANSEVIVTIVGCKNDLIYRKDVSTEEGEAFAIEHNIGFIEVSAKTGENVKAAFQNTAIGVYIKILTGKIVPNNESDYGVTLHKNPIEKKKICCSIV